MTMLHGIFATLLPVVNKGQAAFWPGLAGYHVGEQLHKFVVKEVIARKKLNVCHCEGQLSIFFSHMHE